MDPNTQFLNEISLAKNLRLKPEFANRREKRYKLGQTLSEIIKIIGNESGSWQFKRQYQLAKNRVFQFQKGKTSPSERTELLLKIIFSQNLQKLEFGYSLTNVSINLISAPSLMREGN